MTMPRETPEDCVKRADYARRRAGRSDNPEDAKTWLAIAEEWEKIARELEKPAQEP